MIEISRPKDLSHQPLVSVLMLAYNHEPYLAQAIEGVLVQQCDFPIELIVAEDCSTDGTRSVAERYLAERPDVIRIVTGERNIGVMPNFFRALSQCRGEYIAFCEGDDWWCHPQKLQKQIDLFGGDGEIGMVHGNFVNCRPVNGEWHVEQEGVHDGRPREQLSGDLFASVLRELIPRTCTVMYRRAVLDDFSRSILANPEYRAGDFPIAVFCSAIWRIGYVDEIVSVYRLSPKSATRTDFKSKVRFLDSVSVIYEDIERLYGSRSDFEFRASLWAHLAHAKAAFRCNDGSAFAKAMSHVRRIEPSAGNSLGLLGRELLLRIPAASRIVNATIDAMRKQSSEVKDKS